MEQVLNTFLFKVVGCSYNICATVALEQAIHCFRLQADTDDHLSPIEVFKVPSSTVSDTQQGETLQLDTRTPLPQVFRDISVFCNRALQSGCRKQAIVLAITYVLVSDSTRHNTFLALEDLFGAIRCLFGALSLLLFGDPFRFLFYMYIFQEFL